MGQLLCAETLAPANQDSFQLLAALTHDQSAALGNPATPASTIAITESYTGNQPVHVIIDFSLPQGIPNLLQLAQQQNAALLIATTGYPDSTAQLITTAATKIPILIAANTSLGVNITRQLAQQATQKFGPGTRIEIIEAHHQHKKDAPSGTALALGNAINEVGGNIQSEQYHALRGGGVIGEHTIRFFAENEYVEIKHVATDRRLFAAGALQAATWLAAQNNQPGLYTMDDVLATTN